MEVKIGQIWRDNDKRHTTRLVEVIAIVGDRAVVFNPATEKRTKIMLKRFKPTSQGYVLVKDV